MVWDLICNMLTNYLLPSNVYLRQKSFKALALVWQQCSELFTATVEKFGLRQQSIEEQLSSLLSLISGFSYLLLAKYAHQLDENGKSYIENITSATRRMKQLIEDLLMLSRMTHSEITFKRVDLSAIHLTLDNCGQHSHTVTVSQS